VSRTLTEVAAEAAGCTKCRLAEGRTQVVFGVGNPDADVMFIGEAPGFHEDKQGEPFVGAAGQLLTRMLNEVVGVRRDDVYICNVLKCLRYNATVQLADGSWERIGRLVRRRYEGSVLSVESDGTLAPRRVVGWHATPLAGRRVFQLTYRSARRAGAGRVSIQLTGDHPVLTERGYVQVHDLHLDDRIAIGQGLSDVAMDVVCGSLLGDSYLSSKSSYLAFAHSAKQSAYAHFKASLLEELKPRVARLMVAAVVGGERAYPVVQVRTLADRALGVLRRDFYGPRKRVPAWVHERLNERMLAFWFMDDGHLRLRPDRRPLAEIAANGFSEEDREVLVDGLGRMGIAAKSAHGRIHFGVESTEALSEAIAPFAPPSMRYKVHPDIALRIPFDHSRLTPGARRTLYDRAEKQDVTERYRTDTTFYCIDVEGTNNFVTAGGVVHNCRPPGNRDPQDDEIESCTPWLVEQVSLIQPRVIATLGNFATKFVLQTQQGITRMRGRTYEWHGRTVIPTFHPAAVLRGGGESSRQFGEFRDDFELIRDTLAEPQRPAEPQGTGAQRPEPERRSEPVAVPEAQPAAEEQLELF
jgi:uracil-DNA glycosylase family 4